MPASGCTCQYCLPWWRHTARCWLRGQTGAFRTAQHRLQIRGQQLWMSSNEQVTCPGHHTPSWPARCVLCCCAKSSAEAVAVQQGSPMTNDSSRPSAAWYLSGQMVALGPAGRAHRQPAAMTARPRAMKGVWPGADRTTGGRLRLLLTQACVLEAKDVEQPLELAKVEAHARKAAGNSRRLVQVVRPLLGLLLVLACCPRRSLAAILAQGRWVPATPSSP
jgi:hypothetical protein